VDRVPILKIGDVLLVSIQMDMEDQVALQLQEDLADGSWPPAATAW
jgi:rsbT antagonist protein RsbS